MSKNALQQVDAEIERRRSEVSKLHEQLEDLEDYLDVLEGRRQSAGKRTYTQSEMEKRYRVGK